MSAIIKSSRIPSLPTRDDFFFPLEQQFDKFFRDFFRDSNLDAVRATGGYPKLDIYEDEDYWILKAAVPGVQSDDLVIEMLDGGGIRISGSMSSEHRIENEVNKWYHRELHKSKFRRDISLPTYVSGDPEAVLKDGILTLKWVKDVTPDEKLRRINIKTE